MLMIQQTPVILTHHDTALASLEAAGHARELLLMPSTSLSLAQYPGNSFSCPFHLRNYIIRNSDMYLRVVLFVRHTVLDNILALPWYIILYRAR